MSKREYSFLLRNGKRVLVDEEDYDLKWYSWHMSSTGVVEYIYYDEQGKQKHVALRRIIAERITGRPLQPKERAVQKNCDPLDCRRENICLGYTVPFYQRRVSKRNSTGYRGVRRHTYSSQWEAFFRDTEGKHYRIGAFDTPEEAAWAYNQEAVANGVEPPFLNTFSDEMCRVLEEKQKQREALADGVTEFKLKTGQMVFVSPEDKDLSKYVWHIHRTMGIGRRVSEEEGRPYVFLKRIIGERMAERPLSYDDLVTHRDKNIFNCRRDNLVLEDRFHWRARRPRQVTHLLEGSLEDQCIIFDEGTEKWVAVFPQGTDLLYLGMFYTKDEALLAYRSRL